ncbi:VanZ family protein [Shewanella sp. UCD-KL12]|uniref:VanZ family protein n=1 Tax=Shewanella sp. UCD-KL12 TaxID=1917163 RepID=UPI000970246F|nr:VanZ family protein [Shewanella sp. UCD-KL12]
MTRTNRKRIVYAISSSFFMFIVWMIYTANTGGHSILFELVGAIPYGDKLGHILLFGLLTLCANFTLNFATIKLSLRSFEPRLYKGSLLVIVFVLLEEGTQYYIPTRTFDIYDILADGLGIGMFTFISYLCHKRCSAPSTT